MKKYLFILISLILSSFPAYATLYAAPELKNADDMLNILPEQSLKITKQFLNKRKLLDSDSKNLIISRDGAENTTRTPASSVHAMQIMAKAYDALNLPTIALATIKEAQQIASVNQLIYLDIQSQIIQTQIRWHHQENPNQLIQNLNQIEDQLEAAQPKNSALNELTMQTYLLKANIFSSEQNPKQAQANFQHAEKILDSIDDPIQKINFHLEYGGFYLNTDDFDNALTQLLISYWMAIESSESSLLAQTNYQLSKLFFARQVYDKSLEHSSEAADFYKKYPDSKHLSQAISMMADSYFNQGQFNLALVHYLNILGNDQIRTHNENIDLWLNITKSYLSLSDKHHAKTYLDRAQNLLNTSFDPQLQAKANLLNAGLAMLNHDYDKVIEQSNKAIAATSAKDPENIRLSSYQMLSRAYEAKQQPTFALAALKQYQGLFYTKLAKFNAVNEDIFKQQKDIIEKSLHYSGLEKRIETANDSIAKYQRLTLFGVTITCVIFLMLIRRIFSNKNTRQELQKQTQQLYTHPRTGLQNLRMLNAKLPNSLLQSSTILEQWRLGELIDEPLTDRLHFVLFDIPQLREYYLTQGYNNGLKLEKALGEHLNKQVDKPARIYHFSETSFLYITPQQHPALTPEDLFEKVKAWLAPFETIQQPLNMGIINYPFLSKAFTAINAQELIDILLSAISLADKVSALPDEANQQWVHIHAIDNAPAASFASKHIRQACLKSMQQGLVKLASSAKNEEALREVYMDILSQYQPKSSTQTNAKDN